MKRHGGGARGEARGGARARGVLRADTAGNATNGPAGGNATNGPAGGNATNGPDGGNATTGPPGGNDTAANDTENAPAENTTRHRFLFGAGSATTLSPEQIDALFPHPDTSQTCSFIYNTVKTPGAAIILFRRSGSLLCMGSIIDHKHILTSKRCVNIAAPHHLLVILGCSKPWWGRKSQVKKVKKILNHEYEAALLRLKDRIVYTKYVQPARLPSSATKNTKLTWLYDGPYYVMGFAVDKHGVPGERISKKLYYGLQPDWYFELEFCEKIHTKFVLDPNRVFCVAGGVTFCWGAWGAPVLAKVNNIMIQIGVVTADACTSIKSGPYLAFRTDAYAEWIRGHLMELHQPT